MAARIQSVNGPVVGAVDVQGFKLREMVLVGKKQLIGEIIEIRENHAIIQVYEETEGLQLGEEVISTGEPLHVKLAPGILGHIYDGISRPLDVIEEKEGAFLTEGIGLLSIDEQKKWEITFTVEEGDELDYGASYGYVQETPLIKHYLMLSHTLKGVVKKILTKEANITQTVLILEHNGKEMEISMQAHWPVRVPRPLKERLGVSEPLITGQRVIDMFFPIAKGGSAAIPGGFGTGKTITQHQIAKWSDADIIVYIGCGERGNEMTDVLEEFRNLVDPKSKHKLIERTILIANTSNMPVAAREASIYTGITLAEYYRDMGYHVAIMADSTARWAEALREISGRLEEIPAEEGYPAYLASRLAEFYERAGVGETYTGKIASISVIGAVSPAGGDFSEPVTENTRRFINAFLALDKKLAYARHYPSIDWMSSYSEYNKILHRWYEEHVGEDTQQIQSELMAILHGESQLKEIVQLVGEDVLPDSQRLTLEIAKVIKVGFLQQNAFHDVDMFVPLEKQYLMMKCIAHYYERAKRLIDKGLPISEVMSPELYQTLTKMKYDIKNDELKAFDKIMESIDSFYNALEKKYRDSDYERI